MSIKMDLTIKRSKNITIDMTYLILWNKRAVGLYILLTRN